MKDLAITESYPIYDNKGILKGVLGTYLNLSDFNNILDLSKIEARKVDLMPEWIYMESFVNRTENFYAPLAYNKNVTFKIEVQNDVPERIFVDTIRLNQIIANLLGNAIKFAQNGEIKLNIKKSKSLGNKVLLMFSIHDTGIGIKKKIFQNFLTILPSLMIVTQRGFKEPD